MKFTIPYTLYFRRDGCYSGKIEGDSFKELRKLITATIQDAELHNTELITLEPIKGRNNGKYMPLTKNFTNDYIPEDIANGKSKKYQKITLTPLDDVKLTNTGGFVVWNPAISYSNSCNYFDNNILFSDQKAKAKEAQEELEREEKFKQQIQFKQDTQFEWPRFFQYIGYGTELAQLYWRVDSENSRPVVVNKDGSEKQDIAMSLECLLDDVERGDRKEYTRNEIANMYYQLNIKKKS